jgi:hypothetical protein
MNPCLLLAILALFAQARPLTFKVRLSTVPIDTAMRATVTGSGSATATLAGNKLTITGAFEGMQGPATVARIHQGKVTGVRGPSILDLTVAKDVKGALSGTISLTPEQLDNLKKGRLYIQIHSEKAPDGNLWGWLLR